VGRLASLEDALRQSGDAYWASQVEIQRLAAQAWLAHAQGRPSKALAAMRQAADLEDATEKRPVTPGPLVPARELLGDLLLELDRPAEALDAFRIALAESPSRFNSLAGAACAARRLGGQDTANRYARQLPRADARSRGGRFELARGKSTPTCNR
jgi:tetratricopeptide (TPR) repeat protein